MTTDVYAELQRLADELQALEHDSAVMPSVRELIERARESLRDAKSLQTAWLELRERLRD